MGDILDFKRPDQLELAVVIRIHRSGKPHCPHKHKLVDSNARIVVCAKCNAELDPMDTLVDIARTGSYVLDLTATRKRLESELRDLRAQVSKLKRRVRRNATPQLAVKDTERPVGHG